MIFFNLTEDPDVSNAPLVNTLGFIELSEEWKQNKVRLINFILTSPNLIVHFETY